MGLRIAVVGGSVAGCAAGAELRRSGHEVTVFERSTLEPHGAGIGLLPNTFQSLVSRELVPADLPRLDTREHVFAARSGETPLGRVALRSSTEALVVHWSHLWRALRANLPSHSYRAGVAVTGVTHTSERGATLRFADGTTSDFELVVFADGYRSIGRSIVCPEFAPSYRNYLLWRAVVRVEPSRAEVLRGSIYRLSHGDVAGHSVAYVIPPGDINFAAYLPLPAAELETFLVDRNGVRHGGSLPPGSMPDETEERLRSQLRSRLPPYFARVLDEARDTFAQPVFTAVPGSHRRGRIVILGDAGTLVPPLTGSGVSKALLNVFSLNQRLRGAADLDGALTAWDAEAAATGAVLGRLGAQMEQALVWNMPDLSTISEADAQVFWTAATRLPA